MLEIYYILLLIMGDKKYIDMKSIKLKESDIKRMVKRVLNEQEGLPSKTIFQIKLSEYWGKGTDNKGELFFEDYDKAIDYLTSKGYEHKDYPIPIDYEYWEKDYGNQAQLYRQQLIT